MIMLKNADLRQMVEEGDVRELEDTVRAYQYEVADMWANLKMDELEKSLQLAEQKADRAKRILEDADKSKKRIFTLGVLKGVIEIMKEIFREEKKEQLVIKAFAAQTEKTDAILKALYTGNGGQGMRHGELAEAVGTSNSNLTNTMKRVLESNAATSVKSGKNTYYMLTKVGRRYCENKAKAPERYYPRDPLERAKGALAELEEQGWRPASRNNDLAVRAGDEMAVYTGKNIGFVAHMKVERIIGTQSGKIALCDEINYTSTGRNGFSRYRGQAGLRSGNADRLAPAGVAAV